MRGRREGEGKIREGEKIQRLKHNARRLCMCGLHRSDGLETVCRDTAFVGAVSMRVWISGTAPVTRDPSQCLV